MLKRTPSTSSLAVLRCHVTLTVMSEDRSRHVPSVLPSDTPGFLAGIGRVKSNMAGGP